MSERPLPFIAWLIVVAALTLSLTTSANAQVKVELTRDKGQFQLLRDGKPFAIRGVGGDSQLEKLAALGGNSIRTWDTKDLGRILNEAHSHGLTVCAGIWLGHPRHGFDYQNQDAVLKQLDRSLDAVRKHSKHPALLLWAVGNEMEGEGRDPSVWYAVNHVAREIKPIDPNHPTMTVIAEIGEEAAKLKSIERFCPNIDIIGVNAYGGVESLGKRYATGNSSKPYIVTEHGPLGPWEVGKTAWGSPVEMSSTEKGEWYRNGFNANVVDNAKVCLGSYAFLWGHKQETTATWFGMLLPDGSRLAAVDAMSELWTGVAPPNRCPQIASIKLSRKGPFEPGDTINASVTASDPEQDALKVQWLLRSDAGTIGDGGDPQESETAFKAAVRSNGNKATVTLPDGGGGYRLFAYVRDGHGGAAVANVPINVPALIKLKSTMPPSQLPFAVYANDSKNSVYAPSGYMGNVDAISMDVDCTDNPHAGLTCLKVQYNSNASWGGVLWQSPAEDWEGQKPGGANLVGATHLEFWARGEQGGEKVNFVFGVLDGSQPYRDTAKGELKDTRLSKEWKKFSIPLEGLDLRQIKTGFGWSLAGQGRPLTFYLDDIKYVGPARR